MMNELQSELLFLKSALSDGSFMKVNEVEQWLIEQNEQVEVSVKRTEFSALDHWGYDDREQNIRHHSGRFFSIDGIRIKTNYGWVEEWEQPIINQPEIGYLGFITKEFDGVLHFLVQAKIEPGNLNYVQLSPTLQATRSNYTQVHGGKKPLYLDYFKNAGPDQILLDQLQSEQGSRFLRKRNRNIIIKIDDDIEVYDNFIWLSLKQLKELITFDNRVNMDTRTVISGIPYGSSNKETHTLLSSSNFTDKGIEASLLRSALGEGNALHSIREIITFLTHLKSVSDLSVRKVDLKKLDSWTYSDREIYHKDQKYFKVIAVDVKISNREMVQWGQPMVEPAQEGLCAMVCKEINGVLHFLIQAKMECGNHDIIEFAPTVQCLTGNYRNTPEGILPFLEYVLKISKDQVVFDTLQSEEGGRFYREQNRNMLIKAGDEIPIELPERYIWMTLSQINTFIQFNNYLNIQARSLISAIPFI